MSWRNPPPPPLGPIDFERATRAIVQVGNYGRGFMCENSIVTAASCLPHLPTFDPFRVGEAAAASEYKNIIGNLGEQPTRSAFCTFVDTVSNIAILDELPEPLVIEGIEFEATTITDWALCFRVRRPRGLGEGVTTHHRVWVYLAKNEWCECYAVMDSGLSIFKKRNNPDESLEPLVLDGVVSGSPIVDEEGAAIGMVCVPETIVDDDEYPWVFSHPILAWHLPGLKLRYLYG